MIDDDELQAIRERCEEWLAATDYEGCEDCGADFVGSAKETLRLLDEIKRLARRNEEPAVEVDRLRTEAR